MNGNKRAIATDLTKLDAHVVQPSEYEDAPELTDEELAQADLHEGGVLIRRGRGRPPSPARKVPIKFRLDPDLVAKLRASGPGYQTRVNETLREAVLGSRRPWRMRSPPAGKLTAHPMTARKASAPARAAATAPSRKPATKSKKSKIVIKPKSKKTGHARAARRTSSTKRPRGKARA